MLLVGICEIADYFKVFSPLKTGRYEVSEKINQNKVMKTEKTMAQEIELKILSGSTPYFSLRPSDLLITKVVTKKPTRNSAVLARKPVVTSTTFFSKPINTVTKERVD